MWASLNKASSLHRHPTERLLSGLASSKEPLRARHIDVATSGVTAQTDCKTKRQTPSPVFQYRHMQVVQDVHYCPAVSLQCVPREEKSR